MEERAHLSLVERGARCPVQPDPADWVEPGHGQEPQSSKSGTPPSFAKQSRERRKVGKDGERHKAQLSLSPETQRGSERTRWGMVLGGVAERGQGLCHLCC